MITLSPEAFQQLQDTGSVLRLVRVDPQPTKWAACLQVEEFGDGEGYFWEGYKDGELMWWPDEKPPRFIEPASATHLHCPHAPGDVLGVQEDCRFWDNGQPSQDSCWECTIRYRADNALRHITVMLEDCPEDIETHEPAEWVPSPDWACRLYVHVVEVRRPVNLSDIGADDIERMGIDVVAKLPFIAPFTADCDAMADFVASRLLRKFWQREHPGGSVKDWAWPELLKKEETP